MNILLDYIHSTLLAPPKQTLDSDNHLIITFIRPAFDVSHHYQDCI